MSPFIRKVKSASNATVVQTVEKRGGVRRIVEHVGSARDETDMAVILHAARERLHEGQQEFDLGVDGGEPDQAVSASTAVVTGTRCDVCDRLPVGRFSRECEPSWWLVSGARCSGRFSATLIRRWASTPWVMMRSPQYPFGVVEALTGA